MIVFAILVFFVLFFKYLVSLTPEGTERQTRENLYANFIFGAIVLLAAFRGEQTGADTPGYIRDYFEVAQLRWDQIADRFEGYSMYYYLSKVFADLNLPLFMWFGFVEYLYMFAIKNLIDKYSKDKLLSYLVFMSVGLLTFSFAGLKQVMAMSFILYAYILFINKRYLYALILALMGFMSHSTTLIFFPAFFFFIIRNRKIFWPLILIVVVVLSIYGGEILTQSTELYEKQTGNQHFNPYINFVSKHSSVMLIYYLALLLYCIPGLLHFRKIDRSLLNISLGLCLLVPALQVLAFFTPHAFRLAYYYLPFYLVLMPNSYTNMRGKMKKIMRVLIITSLVFYFLYVNRNFIYTFA